MRRAAVGVIGTGWWATEHHIPSLLGYERAQVTSLADPNETKLAAVRERFEIPKTYHDHTELIASGDAEGVIIAVPHALHYPIARDALNAGLHVLVEKPMTLKAVEAWDLVERAEANDLHLTVGYTFQFTSHASAARDTVRSGRLGDVRLVAGVFASMVESYFRGHPQDYDNVFEFPVARPDERTYSDPLLAGGGQGHTQVTHAMGMVFWVTGAPATEVFAQMEQFDLAVDLADSISYRLANGALGSMGAIGSLRPHQPQQQGLSYYGTEGFMIQDLVNGKLSVLSNDGRSTTLPDLPSESIYPAGAPSRHLVDLILEGGENRAPGKAGALTVEFLEAAYRSAREGRSIRLNGSGRNSID